MKYTPNQIACEVSVNFPQLKIGLIRAAMTTRYAEVIVECQEIF